ncbi:MAG TPA: hypothetical protein RMG48_06340 [Myxococcales bacterium LLY-WYZ-16_1]|jgi:pimeloyl-ACP methyl ester carboxylesterase|nr:hypothetical protein [Myxococcales bacterium LLY-WYZ-16_1]
MRHILWAGALFISFTPASAHAVDHTGGAFQFSGGFQPSNAPYGGFGGGNCTASRTPVIFVHGNGDEAKNWDFPPSTGVPSVYETFRAAGYNDCELFGITHLSSTERTLPQFNFHDRTSADRIRDFILDVLAYTGASEVDVVGHSLGVTVSLHGIDFGNLWPMVRRFVAIGGAVRGLASCYYVGPGNPAATTCGSQNWWDSNVFGLHPSVWYGPNPRMANGGFRDRPAGLQTEFYSIHAGFNDQILCTTTTFHSSCFQTALFDPWSNVRAQLDVGYGSTAAQIDLNFADWSPFNLGGGDSNGVGHFRSKNNTGQIQLNMLTSACSGTGCCAGYADPCR